MSSETYQQETFPAPRPGRASALLTLRPAAGRVLLANDLPACPTGRASCRGCNRTPCAFDVATDTDADTWTAP